MRAFTFDFDVDDAPCSHSDIEEKEKEESYPSVRNLEIHQEEKGARVEWTSGSFDYAAIPFSLVRVPQSTSSADTEEHCVVDSKSIRFQVVDTSDPKVLEKAESMQTILISSDIKSGFYEGGFKIWECSLDLVAYLNEIVSKGYVIPSHVMELGCGHGLPGIYALKNGAERVTFTDYNREVLSLITIPNLVKNMHLPIEQLRDRVSLYAGSWESVTKYIRDNEQQCRTRYQADLILSAETLYTENVTSDLYQMIKRHLQLSNPKAIALVASKRYYFGTGGSVKHFLDLVNNDNANLEAKVVWCADNHRSNIREIVRVKAK